MHYAYKLVWITARGETLPARYSNCFPRLLKSAKAESTDKQKGHIGILFARTVDSKWKAYAYVFKGWAWDEKCLPMEEDCNV